MGIERLLMDPSHIYRYLLTAFGLRSIATMQESIDLITARQVLL